MWKWLENVGFFIFFFFQAEDGIRDIGVTGVQTCALPIWPCAGIAPRAGMNTDRPHERAEPQLTFCHGPSRVGLSWLGDRHGMELRHHAGRRRLFCFQRVLNTTVIPGRDSWREPGIHTPCRGYGFRARASRAPE